VVIILKWMIKTGYEGVDFIRVAQVVYQWRALLNAVMNLRVYGLCCMELIFMWRFINPI
jgi:hypothetical protein